MPVELIVVVCGILVIATIVSTVELNSRYYDLDIRYPLSFGFVALMLAFWLVCGYNQNKTLQDTEICTVSTVQIGTNVSDCIQTKAGLVNLNKKTGQDYENGEQVKVETPNRFYLGLYYSVDVEYVRLP